SDELGRQVREESNYQPSGNDGKGGILPEGQWRQTSAASYDGAGRQVGATDSGGRATTTTYDSMGRPEETTRADGTVVRTSYDPAAGTTTSRTLTPGEDTPMTTSTGTVDDQGNPLATELVYGDGTPGSRTEATYDGFGRPTRTQDDRTVVDHAYTPAGALDTDSLRARSGEGPELTAQHSLDAFGAKTSKDLTQDGRTTEGWKILHDSAGRTTSVSLPGDGGTSTTTYGTGDGLVESVTQPDGAVVHQEYDEAGRVVASWLTPKDRPEVRENHVRTSYDAVTGQVAAQWLDGDEDGSKISYTYFPDGSLKERTDPGGRTTSFTYTDDGRTATVTDHTGAVTSYRYDPESGRMTAATQTRDGGELARVGYTYDAAGRLEKVDRGNGAVSTYAFNDAGLPTAEKHTGPHGDVIAEHAYTYTPRQQLATDTAVVRDHQGKETRTATSYTYDDQGRMTGSGRTEGDRPGEGTLVSRSTHDYDTASNLIRTTTVAREADGTERTTTTGYTQDHTSRTVGVDGGEGEREQKYDAAGRLTHAADGTRHTYDTGGRLIDTADPDGTRVSHTYNAAGERSTQTTRSPDGTENTITYLPGTESDQNGATATYLSGISRETRTLTAPGGAIDTSYYLANRHGDKTHTLDGVGNATGHTRYTDYGAPVASEQASRAGTLAENPYGYAGEYTTPTGLQSLGARWYQPGAAAFTTPDTPAAGMLNPYVYATGDPVNLTDPTGQSPGDAWNWFDDNVLSWDGMPYVDVALAALGVAAATIASGGTLTIPVALALTSAVATVGVAAEQIASDITGESFMSDGVRTAVDVTALVAGVGGGVVAGLKGPKAVKTITDAVRGTARAGAVGASQAAPGGSKGGLVNRLLGNTPAPTEVAPAPKPIDGKNVIWKNPDVEEQVRLYRVGNDDPTAFGPDGGTIFRGIKGEGKVVTTKVIEEMPDGTWAQRNVTNSDDLKSVPLDMVPKTVLVHDPVTKTYTATANYRMLDIIMFTIVNTTM
ncbi:RHS repeat-associated core domain-containing protein, partial [Streptomyces cyaneofuscatus]|uniref:RHS repeat-associated core domain-containing protein n=1 Tax=Streptomyces cyaneofuscatus TaxID=66883 RepID=UPI0036618CB7